MEKMLKQIMDKLETMDAKIDRIEKKLDATFEEAARSAEAATVTKSVINTHDHGIDILNRKIFRLETEVEKIKNK